MGTILIRTAAGADSGLEARTAGDQLAGAAPARAEADPEVRVEEDLSEGDKADLEASPEWITADAMPLTLIEPETRAADDDGTVDPGDGSRAAWGVVATGATDSRLDGRGVRVAVLDTGIDRNHPAFAGVNLVERNFTRQGPDDTDGHGTHCAGTVFGRDVGGVRIGVARGVTQAFIAKVIPGGSDDLVKALIWARDSGASIASMSLGFDFARMLRILRDQNGMPEPAAMSVALRNFRNNIAALDTLIANFRARSLDGGGMIVVAASGNESSRGVPPAPGYTVAASSPAASLGIVAVGALQRGAAGLSVAGFSNTFPQICAPGVGVLSAKAGTQGLTAMNGTSMACPHAAGIAALHWQEAQEEGGAWAEAVAARLTGRAVRTGLAPGANRLDIGQGLCRAP